MVKELTRQESEWIAADGLHLEQFLTEEELKEAEAKGGHVQHLVDIAHGFGCESRNDVLFKVCTGSDEQYVDRVWELVRLELMED